MGIKKRWQIVNFSVIPNQSSRATEGLWFLYILIGLLFSCLILHLTNSPPGPSELATHPKSIVIIFYPDALGVDTPTPKPVRNAFYTKNIWGRNPAPWHDATGVGRRNGPIIISNCHGILPPTLWGPTARGARALIPQYFGPGTHTATSLQ